MKLFLKIAAGLVLFVAAAGLAGYVWSKGDPAVCATGQDPGIAVANDMAGGSGIYTERCHSFEGQALHVIEAGESASSGETVLFIHGFPSYWYSLQRPMEALRGDYRVVAIDGLGAGYSDAPNEVERYSLAEMARHIDALIDDLGEEKVHLVGHDWGAAFVLAYAQDRPQRVLSVTGMSAPPQNIAVELLRTSPEQREKSAYVELLKSASPLAMVVSGASGRIASGPESHFEAGRISREEADALQQATSDLRRINRHINWYRANLPAPDSVTEDDYWPSREARLSVPALLVWGEDDDIFEDAFIDMMLERNADLKVLRLEGVGHAPQFEATEAVNQAIAAHVRGASPAQAEAVD